MYRTFGLLDCDNCNGKKEGRGEWCIHEG
ncbi:hypothetical protein TB2_033924 [Malus domestica]